MSAFRDTGPQAALIAGGHKLHLHHGPIDLIVEACGAAEQVRAAYGQARAAFQTVLTDLVEELPVLRRPCADAATEVTGVVALRMDAAVRPHDGFITPMAAVAGSVADYILERLMEDRSLSRAYVNNGGDIALHLGEHETFRIGVCVDPVTAEQAPTVTIGATDGIGGIATSGWRGRSHSLGIADAVTVLASNAAAADAAATLIANAIDLPGSSSIVRRPANELSPDSDLGSRPVTVEVGRMSSSRVAEALDAGEIVAGQMIERGLIASAFLALQGSVRITGHDRCHTIGSVEQSTYHQVVEPNVQQRNIPHFMRDPGQNSSTVRSSPGLGIRSRALAS